MAATDAGTVLGTVGYMAPEQVRGEGADPRSDLFALGVVLYELASGQRAFLRPTAAETMTAILREDPPELTTASASSSPGLSRIVRHAIEKDPNDRFQSARDFAFALAGRERIDQFERGAGSDGRARQAAGARPRERRVDHRGVAGGHGRGDPLVAARRSGDCRVARHRSRRRCRSETRRCPRRPCRPTARASRSFRAADRATRSSFAGWIRCRLSRSRARRARGRAGSSGRQMDARLASLPAAGSRSSSSRRKRSRTLQTRRRDTAARGDRTGPSCSARTMRSPIFRVSAKGGEATAVTTLDPAQERRGAPLAAVSPRWPPLRVHAVDVRHGHAGRRSSRPSRAEPRRRCSTPSRARSLPATTSSSCGICRCRVSWRRHSIPRRSSSRAVPSSSATTTSRSSGTPATRMASASPRMLVYTTGKLTQSQLTWFSRTGRPLGTVGDPDVYYDPTISPDGTTLAVEKPDADRGASDLWTVDLARGAFSRLTSAPGFQSVPTWSPDGHRIAFGSDPGPGPKLWVKNASGTGTEDVLVDGRSFPMDWSHDGRHLLYVTGGWRDAAGRVGVRLRAQDIRAACSIRRSTSPEPGSRQTVSGSRTSPTRPAPIRCTCVRFLTVPRSFGFPPPAAQSLSGGATERNCSSLRRTAR